ncbi:MAG: FKBP-type peptidyl-prolyl cis-trans isomerase, partial [Candidatus Neomarinimicrobiota bacterium]
NFKSRGIQYNIDSFFNGFIETYNTDTSYAYGANLAANFIMQGIDISPSILLRAFANTTSDDSLLLTNAEIKDISRKFQDQMRDEASQRTKREVDKNRAAGESYIAEYRKSNQDVIALESGMAYRVLTEGFGDIPTDKDRVVVHYTGKVIDGTVFDSSVDRGEPSKFMVGSVIQGWQEALQLMKVGSKWELVIPSNLAYGERATGNIPTSSTLIFEVELLGIE